MMDKFFKDKHGKWAVMQRPNLPIIIWGVATVASKIFSHGTIHNFFTLVAFGSIFLWAYLEITAGLSYFRRVLGVVVMILSIWSRL